MARLIPKILPKEISNKGERDVATALVEQLPDECVIYHSYPWLRSDRDHKKVTLREGETDFVIVHPKFGLLVLEVKGGTIEYDETSRAWFRREYSQMVEIKDPFEQARKGTHQLEEMIRRESFRSEKHIPCPYGYAVVFPDCVYDGRVPPGADTSMVFSANDLAHLGKRVTDLLGKWKPANYSVDLTSEQLRGIQLGLSPAFQLLPVLFRKIEEQEERLFRLTQDQTRLLDFLNAHHRAAIKGVAGSGKTLLAGVQAQKFARQGKKTLLVCFNKPLAEWLRQSLPEEFRDLITIRHFHGLCSDYCRKAHVSFSPTKDSAFWKATAPDLFMQALDRLPDDRFDAVVVDEGQDFHPDWWIPMEIINRGGESGPFYVFFDPAQNLFMGDDLALPDLGTPFELPINCRNTKQIAATCSSIRGVTIPVRDDAPDGIETKVEVVPDSTQRMHKVRQYIDEWFGQGKLKLSQIAILSPYEQSKSCLANADKIGKVNLTTDLDHWRANDGVLFSTIRSFKGLEADAIVVTDVPNPQTDAYFTTADFYVGCSRAKHLLVILATEHLTNEK